MVAKSIHCIGKVQGVYFRASTKDVAKDLGLSGWVRNQADGTVMIHAEGDENAVNQLIDWCKRGPEYAVVKSVDVADAVIEGYGSFDIIR
ncbi:MAG: acylphosphatase [Cyclobacteriaceae bacterium]